MKLQANTVIAKKYTVIEPHHSDFDQGYLVQEITSGEFGVLHVVPDTILANKTLMFYLQASLKKLTTLQCDCVPKVREWNFPLHKGDGWIITEQTSPMNLFRYVEQSQRLSLEGTIRTAQQIQVGIDWLTTHDIAVLRLNPNRVLVDTMGNVKLNILESLLYQREEQSGTLLENPLWHSPWELQGTKNLNSTYLWRLGLITYYMLTGSHYWQRYQDRMPQIVYAIVAEKLPVPSEQAQSLGIILSPEYDCWFAKCVTRDPMASYQSLSEAVEQLRSLTSSQSSVESQARDAQANHYRQNQEPLQLHPIQETLTKTPKPEEKQDFSLLRWIKDKLQ